METIKKEEQRKKENKKRKEQKEKKEKKPKKEKTKILSQHPIINEIVMKHMKTHPHLFIKRKKVYNALD